VDVAAATVREPSSRGPNLSTSPHTRQAQILSPFKSGDPTPSVSRALPLCTRACPAIHLPSCNTNQQVDAGAGHHTPAGRHWPGAPLTRNMLNRGEFRTPSIALVHQGRVATSISESEKGIGKRWRRRARTSLTVEWARRSCFP